MPSEQTTTLTTGIFTELAADPKLTRAEAARRSQMKLLAQRGNVGIGVGFYRLAA